MEVRDAPSERGILALYEGTNATQNKVCELRLFSRTVNFKNHRQCDNDEAKSVMIMRPAWNSYRILR